MDIYIYIYIWIYIYIYMRNIRHSAGFAQHERMAIYCLRAHLTSVVSRS